MTFDEILGQAIEMLQRRGRVSYGALKRQFALDDEYLADLKVELIEVLEVAADQDGKMLVWQGAAADQEPETERNGEAERRHISSPADSQTERRPDSRRAEAERRQLTVMFCDLVGSTALSTQLDPEDYHTVVQHYHQSCEAVIQRYGGFVPQHLGDGLLVYFGYPTAHEDDAQRAVRAALGIVEVIQQLSFPTIRLPHSLQVRIGIHTGLVVIGEIGSSEKRERLALGETPNLAARVQGVAAPDTVVMSAITQRLVHGLFDCQDLGPQALKGISTPLSLYRVMGESTAQSRFEVAVTTGLTPLVGREEELGLLQRRWMQAKEGSGQVVLLSGEPGIGKSRLVQVLKEHVLAEGATRLEFRCSPYHQNSALYPIIDHLHRLLQFQREDTSQVKLTKLQHRLSQYRFPQADTFPLMAALLSLPHPVGMPPLTLSPQKQKQKTQEALVAWIMEEAQKSAVYCAWEDLHWADPSTLEVLTLFLDQVPTTRMFTVLTFRPEFTPPWGNRSHLSHLTLSRLGRPHVEIMVEQVTRGKVLPSEVLQQIVTKTDGVPLFIEELTKSVVESVGAQHAVLLPLGIPSTLQDALMARLDRLGTAKEIAQVGATLGREFPYELLTAVSPWREESLQQGLKQLVDSELVYQSGMPPQARYLFKHALVQDTAYRSLLKSTRQQYHQQIARVLEKRFPEIIETQPELVAHHYTEAGLIAQALPYWQRAGERASQRSAHVEAISHLTKGQELLQLLPDTLARTRQELTLQLLLGVPLMATQGWSAPEVERIYLRARTLCEQLGETRQLFSVLRGLWECYDGQGKLVAARELGEQLLSLAESTADPALLVVAHNVVAENLLWEGQFVAARAHAEQGAALYDRQQHHALASLYGTDPGVACLSFEAFSLWMLGYPTQSSQKLGDTLTLVHGLPYHPYSLAHVQTVATWLAQWRREGQAVLEHAEAVIFLSTAQEFPMWVAWATIPQGWALAKQGEKNEGLARIQQGLALYQAIEGKLAQSWILALLAEIYGEARQPEEGLAVLAEALAAVHRTEEHLWEAELYRLKGTLTLQSQTNLGHVSDKSQTSREQVTTSQGKSQASLEAEEYFWTAIEIARKQQAKSLELRATTSLARLWQQQGKQHEAHKLLSDIYNWFTEGFDTKDLQEAKALLEELT